jgi:hypothetical protein
MGGCGWIVRFTHADIGGFNVQEAEAYVDYIHKMAGEEEAAKLPPYRMLPMQALDHTVGYLLMFVIATTFCKTVTVCLSLSLSLID